jgi:hypothetical protein
MKKLLLILLCLPMIGFGQEKRWDVRLGLNSLIPFNNKVVDFAEEWYEGGGPLSANQMNNRIGFISRFSYNHKISEAVLYIPSIGYSFTKFQKGLSNTLIEMLPPGSEFYPDVETYHFISLSQNIGLDISDKAKLSTGFSYDKTMHSYNNDKLSYFSFLFAINYYIHKSDIIDSFLFLATNLPLYFSSESKSIWKNMPDERNYLMMKKWAYQTNRYITIGIGIAM